MTDTENLPAIPEKWCWTTIGEICDLINGKAFKPIEWSSHGIPIVRIQNLNNEESEFNYCDFQVEDKYYFNNGQLLFAWSGTPGTSFGAHIWNRGDAVLNQYIFKVNINESYTDKKFLMHVMNWNVTEYVRKAHGTAGLAHITKNKFETSFIPFPPIAEQHRIVQRIEELFTDLDAGVQELEKAKVQTENYRRAVLKAAFEGKLTEEWRKLNPEIESANNLLAKILIERRITWEKEQLEKMKLNGKIPKSDKWKESYSEPKAVDDIDLPKLPNSWTWVNLGQLTWSVKDGPHYSPEYAEEGIPFITGGNVRPSGVDFDNVKYITKELHKELSQRCKPEVGDILYTKGGTTGIARVNTYDFEFSVWVHVAVLKLVSLVDPFYLQHTLNSPFCYAQSQRFTHGVGNQDLGLTRIVNIILSLPPIEEQREIISTIEYQISVIDQIEKTIDQSLAQAEKLRQSILKKAFEGKLVPQDPNDEPASVLLERIKQEKGRAESRKKPGKGRKVKAGTKMEVSGKIKQAELF